MTEYQMWCYGDVFSKLSMRFLQVPPLSNQRQKMLFDSCQLLFRQHRYIMHRLYLETELGTSFSHSLRRHTSQYSYMDLDRSSVAYIQVFSCLAVMVVCISSLISQEFMMRILLLISASMHVIVCNPAPHCVNKSCM